MTTQTEALKLALEALEDFDSLHGDKTQEAITAIKEALAQQSNEQVEPVAKKWLLHGSFADVASFDTEGFPSFYSKESFTKFKNGELSAPCKGKNCGSLNGWLHSAECRAEHESHYTHPPVPTAQPHDCARSHPHEEMSKECELRTEIARLTNGLANLKAQPKEPEQRNARTSVDSEQQEPVAWLHWLHGPVRLFLNKDEAMMELDRLNRGYPVDKDARQMKPLYTTPPQQSANARTWVGLTHEEIDEAIENNQRFGGFRKVGFAYDLEALLKEKNT